MLIADGVHWSPRPDFPTLAEIVTKTAAEGSS